jgi:hypothetical protein
LSAAFVSAINVRKRGATASAAKGFPLAYPIFKAAGHDRSMPSAFLVLPLAAAAQVAAAGAAPTYLDSLFECEVRPVTNYTTLEPESQSPTFTFKVWYGRIPGSGDEFGDAHGGTAVAVDPSDLLPDEYKHTNALPEDFYLRGYRGEWLRTLRIAPLADQSAGFDALIMSLREGAKPNSREAADALHGICRRRDMAWRQFRETELPRRSG